MTNADKFKSLFGLYATELWSMPEKDFLEWLNSEAMNCSEFPNNWIPCSERLPEEDNWLGGSGKQFSDSVLMTVLNTIDDEKIIDYGHTTDGEWYSERTECYIPHGWKVIAWMPLPEPWKGE